MFLVGLVLLLAGIRRGLHKHTFFTDSSRGDMDIKDFNIQEIGCGDAGQWGAPLTKLARRLWSETFTGLSYYTPEIVKGYTDVAFTEAILEGEISDEKNQFFIVEGDGVLVGYAKMEIRKPVEIIQSKKPIYLSRLYLDRQCHGTGLAKRVLDRLNDKAGALGFLSLWLSVYELNVPAVKFYKKHGFQKVGEWDYPFTSHGKQYVDIDWLMVRPII